MALQTAVGVDRAVGKQPHLVSPAEVGRPCHCGALERVVGRTVHRQLQDRTSGVGAGLLVRRLRQAWPDVRIPFRGDSGFCRQCILTWCERSGVSYIIGLARGI